MATPHAVTPDTPITIKLQYGHENKRTKLPLKDLVPSVLTNKLRGLLSLPVDQDFVFERFSDSAGSFVKLDENNASVYKQLHRAAKAKLKLRIRVSAVARPAPLEHEQPVQTPIESLRMADLHIGSPMPALIPAPPAQPKNESSVAAAQTQAQTTRQEIEDVARQLSGLNSYLNDFRENMAQDYTAAFGGQLPSFLDVPTEPEMPRYPSPPFSAFSVCCNNCNFAIPDHHWHCGICHEGDFDLCQQCLDEGHHCSVPEHYLVKRTVVNGKIVSSTTETISKPEPPVASMPLAEVASKVANEVPGAFSSIQDDFAGYPSQSSRTCNSCISIYDDSNFVTCKDCDDYDLCINCHVQGQHGHHPAHTFAPAINDMILEDSAAAACEPGRGQSHAAICDGCDQSICGVRHKCLDCPDFDYCSGCFKNAGSIHVGHRFVPVYEPLQLAKVGRRAVHYGVRCDGPLCGGRKWIVGERYKCAICHDTDFCANCEALPGNPHNRTHPLIKFRTPVRNVNVTTHEEPGFGGAVVNTHGDRPTRTSSRGTETTLPAPLANASTQAEAPPATPAAAIIEPVLPVCSQQPPPPAYQSNVAVIPEPAQVPDAYYVRDYVPDGAKVEPGKPIFQTWTMYNPTGVDWPVGCALRWVGGDAMLDVDSQVPGSMSTYDNAATSNATVSEIPRGAEYHFSVKLRSPEKIGRAVSYWRLYTPDGTPFGHRLWCDIEVVPNVLESVKQTEPKEASQGKEEPVSEQTQELSESQMVFPKLEKESPASSTHLTAQQEAPEAPRRSSSPIIAEEAEELLSHDDLESVTVDLDDDETTDDGFLTDEEYDMVEADVHH